MRRDLASKVDLPADPARVWSTLASLPDWAEWNPVIPSIEGELATAGRLRLELELPDRAPRTLRAEVMRVLPQRELSWILRLAVPGLLDCEHRFLLQPLDEAVPQGGTRVIQRLRVSGILVPLVWWRLRQPLGTALQRSNAGLKTALQQP